MKYIKYFENINSQQPFYLRGNTLYLSDDFAISLCSTLDKFKKKNPDNLNYMNYLYQKQIKFFNGFQDSREISIDYYVTWRRMYKMNLGLRRSGGYDNQFGNFSYYLIGNSGDSNMHGKNMKWATRECNMNFMIKFYPVIEHIKNFYKIFQESGKGFLEIIDEAISKDNKLTQYKVKLPKQNIELQGDIMVYKYNL